MPKRFGSLPLTRRAARVDLSRSAGEVKASPCAC